MTDVLECKYHHVAFLFLPGVLQAASVPFFSLSSPPVCGLHSTFLADFILFLTLAHFFPISVEFVPVVE